VNKKINYFIKIPISLFLALAIIALPLLAQQSETQNAIREAELQAKTDANSTLWLFFGCIGSILAIALGQLIEPKPPQSSLLGKSPEYVAAYTDAYVKKVKSVRMSNSLIGCGIGTALWVGAYVLLFAAAAATTPTYYY
jgi:hypothetical protein